MRVKQQMSLNLEDHIHLSMEKESRRPAFIKSSTCTVSYSSPSRLCCASQRCRQRRRRGNWWGEIVARSPASHSLAAKMEGCPDQGAKNRDKSGTQRACQPSRSDCGTLLNGDCDPDDSERCGEGFPAPFQAENSLLLRGGAG